MKKFFSMIMALATLASLPAWATTTGDNQTFEGSVTIAKKPVIFKEITAPTGNPATNQGWLYLKDNGGASDLYFENDAGTVTELTAAGGGGVTDLDTAYDGGGSGAGRTITVDQGAVLLNMSHATNNGMELSKSAGTGNVLDIANTGTGRDIDGTGSLWFITKTGAATFASVTAPVITPTSIGGFTGIGSINLDDGVGDSPILTFTDGTAETVTLQKPNTSGLVVTTSATDSLKVSVGSLRVGNGTPGTAAMDGEDLYVEGDSEFDGAVQIDGALTAAGAATLSGAVEFTGATTTATLGAAEQVIIDAATTDHTGTDGALDINFDTATNAAEAINLRLHGVADGGGGSESWTGLEIDIDDDSDAANSLIGININSSDATGSSAIYGINYGSSLETAENFNVGAAAKAIVIDAATVDNTVATGVVDMEFDSNTANAEAVNIKATHLTGGSGQTVSAMELELDSDSGNASDILVGLIVNATDTTATGKVNGLYVKGAGLNAALQADTGYIRIGTGSTPDVTPGDDDLYVEGTIEVDGAARFDGAITANSSITGDGGDTLGGFLNTVTNDTNGKTLTVAECGTIQTNAGAVGGAIWNLPEASTAIGCRYHFTTMAAQNLDINPDDADKILGLTDAAGDAIRNATVGNSVCLQIMDATNIAPCSDPYGTWTDVN